MAYREPHDPPLRTWTLTSPARLRIAGVVSVLLVIAGPAYFAARMQATTHAMTHEWLAALLLTALPGLLVVAVLAFGSDGSRVYGGRGEMRLFRDRLEIPRARRRGVDVFHLAELQTPHFTLFKARVNGLEVNETLVLEIRAGALKRTLAHLLMGEQEQLRRFADDLDRARRGEPLTRDPEPREAPPRDALDERLDEELRKL